MTLSGRDSEIREIIEEFKADHFVVLSHEPGFGATALLEDGLKPALIAQGVITVIWSEWQGDAFPVAMRERIAEAVRDQADPEFFAQMERLDEMLDRIHARTGRIVAILLDQFEDYLRFHARSHFADTFDAELSHAIAGHYGRFIVVFQEHSMKPFERLSQYIPNILGCHRTLSPLKADAAREALVAESERRGMEIEPEVIESLVGCQTVAATGGVHPFFLMRGLNTLLDSESRVKSKVARLSTLELNGGPDRLILESLDKTLSDLSSTSAELLFRWCNILISPEMTRVSLTEKAMSDYAGKLNRFALTTMPMLQKLGVIRSVEFADVTRFEVARESLTPILHDWWRRREAAVVARGRARFRVRSISVAVGAIVAIYLIWLLVRSKHYIL